MWKNSSFDRINIEAGRLLRDFKKKKCIKLLDNLLKKRSGRLWREFEFLCGKLFAEELTEKAIKWVKKQSDPFFVWIHFMDVHHPYLVRYSCSPRIEHNVLEYLRGGKFTANELKEIISLYDDQIRYIDMSIKKFLDDVFEHSTQRIVSIITADHGEQFMEHSGFHSPSPYQEMIHVPLIIVGNGLPEGLEVCTPVSHVDLLPTVMDIIGYQAGCWVEGKSLLPFFREEAMDRMVFINYGEQGKEIRAVLNNEKKLIFKEEYDSWEFYDLVLDPFEKNNFFHEGDAIQEEMKRKMEEIEYSVKSKATYMPKEAEISKHVIDQLRALGYLG